MNNNISRLGFLMDRFNITGRELANALHVDFTLVSKWRNKTRILAPHSSYLKQIVEYFVALDSNIRHDTLKKIIFDAYPNAQLDSAPEIALFLGKWLTDVESNIENTELFPEIVNSKNVIKGQYYIFKDNSGRREAVMHFLDMALSSEQHDLILFSQEDSLWFYEDEEFLDKWRESNLEYLRKNRKISVIHTVDRLYKSIANSLIRWLPLHMTGKTDSYYYPQFMDAPIKTTIYLLKDKAVLFSVTAEGLTKSILTYMCVDPVTIQQFQNVATLLLERSLPLFDKYYQNQSAKLIKVLAKADAGMENNYYINTPPFINVISEDLFRSILEANNVDDDTMNACMECHEIIRAQFYKNCEEKYFRCIYDISRLEKMTETDNIYLSEISLLAGRSIYINRNILSKCINEMMDALRNIPSFEIAILDEPPAPGLDDFDIWAKENSIVKSSAFDTETNMSFAIITKELTAVNSCFHQFNQQWNSIPHLKRDKNWIRQKLFQMFARYEQK